MSNLRLMNLRDIHRRLGVPAAYGERLSLPLYKEPLELVEVGPDIFGRSQRLAPAAALAWNIMREAAQNDDVALELVSGFRSIEYQARLIEKKLENGRSIGEVLSVNAAPGYSEHHSGKAIDITTENSEPLDESFEHTEAFHWLARNARGFGFRMSYPRGNPWGFIYEPWHWAYIGRDSQTSDQYQGMVEV